MRRTLMLSDRLAPRRVAHAWWDGDAGAGGASGGAPAGDGGTPPATGTPPAGGQPATGSTPADAAALQRELEEARKEAAGFRTELRKLQEAAKKADDAKLSEQERISKENAELKAQLLASAQAARATRLSAAAQTAAAKLGFADPEDAERFLDATAIEWSSDDADGRPKNVQQLLSKVLETKPYLKASQHQAPNLGQGPRGQASLTMEQVRRLASEKPEEFNRRFEAGEFRDVMAATAGKG